MVNLLDFMPAGSPFELIKAGIAVTTPSRERSGRTIRRKH